jgi:hypothetical protein
VDEDALYKASDQSVLSSHLLICLEGRLVELQMQVPLINEFMQGGFGYSLFPFPLFSKFCAGILDYSPV